MTLHRAATLVVLSALALSLAMCSSSASSHDGKTSWSANSTHGKRGR